MIPDIEHMPMDGSSVNALTALLDKGSELEPTPDSLFAFGVKADPDIIHTFESLAERCGFDHKTTLGTDGSMSEFEKYNIAKCESHIGFVRTKRGPIPYNMSYAALILMEKRNYFVINVADDEDKILSALKNDIIIGNRYERSEGHSSIAFIELLQIAGFSIDKIIEIEKFLIRSRSHRKMTDDIIYKTENLLANESAIWYLVGEIVGEPKPLYCPSWPLGYDEYHKIREELAENIIGLERWIRALPQRYLEPTNITPESSGITAIEDSISTMDIAMAKIRLSAMRCGLQRIEERCELLRPYQGESK